MPIFVAYRLIMPDPPQSIPGIIGVELADGQSFKFPVVNDLTPKVSITKDIKPFESIRV